jgi:hypothetical protein
VAGSEIAPAPPKYPDFGLDNHTSLLLAQGGVKQAFNGTKRRGPRRRGLSHEQVCILVARDRTGKTVDFVTGRAPLTAAQLRRWLAPVIAPDILLVTDGHAAYRRRRQDRLA